MRSSTFGEISHLNKNKNATKPKMQRITIKATIHGDNEPESFISKDSSLSTIRVTLQSQPLAALDFLKQVAPIFEISRRKNFIVL
jgi:hypothetical protein